MQVVDWISLLVLLADASISSLVMPGVGCLFVGMVPFVWLLIVGSGWLLVDSGWLMGDCGCWCSWLLVMVECRSW